MSKWCEDSKSDACSSESQFWCHRIHQTGMETTPVPAGLQHTQSVATCTLQTAAWRSTINDVGHWDGAEAAWGSYPNIWKACKVDTTARGQTLPLLLGKYLLFCCCCYCCWHILRATAELIGTLFKAYGWEKLNAFCPQCLLPGMPCCVCSCGVDIAHHSAALAFYTALGTPAHMTIYV